MLAKQWILSMQPTLAQAEAYATQRQR